MNKPIFFAVVVIGILATLIYIVFQSQFIVPENTVLESPLPTPNNSSNLQPDPGGVNDLKAGGSSYRDPNGLFTILYPNDYKIDTQNNGAQTRLIKTGATQKGQTEIYDGVLIVLEPVSLADKGLSSWVDENIKTQTTDGTIEIIEPKTSITVNNYPGFTYKTRGLGESQYIVLQKTSDSNNALVITYIAPDPENKGYQTEVNNILSTLELFK